MLQPYMAKDGRWAETWQELGEGAPSLAGFARLCSFALAGAIREAPTLSAEAKTILFAAKERGIIEVKGSNRSFDAPARLLAVHVEAVEGRTLIFRNREKPEVTIRFLAGFRELCEAGLVMHHLFCDFTLTREGFDRARTFTAEETAVGLREATEVGGWD